MSGDLISRSALIAELGAARLYFLAHGEKESIWDIIERLPAVDAAEVVRCKDCKYHQIMENKKSFMYWHNCKLWCADITEDDFCSYGERREDG